MKLSKPLSSGVVQLQRVGDGKVNQARTLRKNMTPAEKKLWAALRGKKSGGFKFRRQQIIDGFIADFFCPAKNLVIEVDGSIHDSDEQKKIDAPLCGIQSARFTRNSFQQ